MTKFEPRGGGFGMPSAWASPSYIRRRSDALAAVEALCRTRKVGLIGSWARRDFHIDQTRTLSLSDIDAYHVAEQDGRCHVEERVAIPLAGEQLTLRLSIHPRNYEPSLSLTSQVALSLVNIYAGGGSEIRDYLLAKFFLTTLRTQPGESLIQASSRGGTLARDALHVKLGLEPTLPTHVQECLSAVAETKCRELLATNPPDSVPTRMSALIGICASRSLSQAEWFVRYLREKYE